METQILPSGPSVIAVTLCPPAVIGIGDPTTAGLNVTAYETTKLPFTKTLTFGAAKRWGGVPSYANVAVGEQVVKLPGPFSTTCPLGSVTETETVTGFPFAS